MRNFIVAIIIALALVAVDGKFCEEFNGRIRHDFHFLHRYRRSNKTVIAVDNFTTSNDCAEFAKKYQGLAFNFSPRGRGQRGEEFKSIKGRRGKFETFFYNCEILECPEFSNFSTLINDTRFDYYTLYAKNLPNENATCIPQVGMFMLMKHRSNYSNARNICTSYGGNLAHIASETRNIKLSRLLKLSTISSTRERNAYVGLSEEFKHGEFLTSDYEPLSCFNYRAWAPSHPPEIRPKGCVAITPEGLWKVFNCNRKLLFLCELFTSKLDNFYRHFLQLF